MLRNFRSNTVFQRLKQWKILLCLECYVAIMPLVIHILIKAYYQDIRGVYASHYLEIAFLLGGIYLVVTPVTIFPATDMVLEEGERHAQTPIQTPNTCPTCGGKGFVEYKMKISKIADETAVKTEKREELRSEI